jgi:hypothetical protein
MSILPTTTNTTLFVGYAQEGTKVTVKVTDTENCVGSGPAQLAAQARQLSVTNSLLGTASPFPRMLGFDGRVLVQEYVEGTTLDEAGLQTDQYSRCAERAFTKMLEISQLRIGPGPPAKRLTHGFLSSRIDRLSAVIRNTIAGRTLLESHILSSTPIREALNTLEVWRGDSPVAIDRPLTFCAHGDFTPQNLLATSRKSDTIFIDPRGEVVWESGLPWWDPAVELASYILFGEIVPELDAGHAPLLQEQTWQAPVFFRRAAQGLGLECDERWPELSREVDFLLAARLLGYVSVCCAYGPPRGVAYAGALLRALPSAVHRIQATLPPRTGEPA